MPELSEYELACAEALLAGTLALMTGHAQSSSGEHRLHFCRKVLTNLQELSRHGCLSPQFRLMLRNLQAHWQRLQGPELPARAVADDRLWHTSPDWVQ